MASPSHMRNRVFSATCAYMGREEDAKEEASPRIVNDGVGAPSRMRSTFGYGTVNMLAVGLYYNNNNNNNNNIKSITNIIIIILIIIIISLFSD